MHPRAKEIFLDVMDRAPDERAALARKRSGDDASLLSDVLGLLRADADAAADGGSGTEAIASRVGVLEPPSPEAGDRIGPYVLREKLGEGGFGVVYLADQEAPIRRRVAIKLLRPGMNAEGVLARFELERQTLARMDHPGICKVLDAGATDDGRSFFVMEHVDAEPLVEYCERRELELDDRLHLFSLVCAAVEHAHQKGVIHRDLKPSNVLVATVDGRPVPKVIDFGIAKATDRDASETTALTLDGQFLGTPAYMSPEQATGSTDVDTRTDVYALGSLLYELLSGTTPFDVRDGSLEEVLRRIREEDPPRPSARVRADRTTSRFSSIPSDLDWIVMRCLAKESERRYATASALRSDLERHLRDQPVEAAPPSRLYTLRKLARRHRVAVGACAAILVALVLGIGGTSYGMIEANHARADLWDALQLAQDEADRARDAELREATEAEEARRQGRISDEVVAFLVDDLLSAVIPSSAPGKGRDVSMREVLDEASRRLEERAAPGGRFASEPAVEATVRGTIGDTYRQLGFYTEAEGHLRRALEVYEELDGPLDSERTITACRLAAALRGLGRYDESRELLERYVDVDSVAIESASREELVALLQLSLLRQRLGYHASAVEILRPAYTRSTELRGTDDYGTGYLRSALAVSLATLDRFDEAEELFRENYEVGLRRDGPDEPDTLRSGANLAAFYLERGKLDRADEVLPATIDGMERMLGRHHEHTLQVRLNLGILRLRQGRLDEAEQRLDELVYELGELGAGNAHDRLLAMLNLSRVYGAQGRAEEAEAVVLEACDEARERLPLGHPFLATATQELAALRAAATD